MSAITQPMQSFKEAEGPIISNSVVLIKVAPESLTKCLDFFLSQQFAFEVQFKTDVSHRPMAEVNNFSENIPPISQANNKQEGIAKKVHDKYISKITETPLPEMAKIAAEFGISAHKLKILFLDAYGQPMYKAYMQARMLKSAELLSRGYRGSSVSKMVGYGDKSSIKFNKMFQKHFGMTPKKYQITMFEKSHKDL